VIADAIKYNGRKGTCLLVKDGIVLHASLVGDLERYVSTQTKKRFSHIKSREDKELDDWLMKAVGGWRSITGVTVTFGSTVCGCWVPGNEQCQRDGFRHFMHRLNRAVYHKRYRRGEQRCKAYGFVENEGGWWHVHAAIEPPSHMTEVEFETCILEKTLDAKDIKIERKSDPRKIVGYMTKKRQKLMFDRVIDALI
jgi:hypothetical protein